MAILVMEVIECYRPSLVWARLPKVINSSRPCESQQGNERDENARIDLPEPALISEEVKPESYLSLDTITAVTTCHQASP